MSLFGNKRRNGEPEETLAEPSGAAGDHQPDPGRFRPTASGAATKKRPREGERAMANIGKSISIKGDLTGSEDVVVEGKVEGKIDLPQNELTIGADGNVHADVHAKTVMVIGRVAGNVSASERVEVQTSGIVEGDVRAPKLVVQEGAVVNGSIQMEGKPGEPKPASQTKPAALSPGAPERRPAPPPA